MEAQSGWDHDPPDPRLQWFWNGRAWVGPPIRLRSGLVAGPGACGGLRSATGVARIGIDFGVAATQVTPSRGHEPLLVVPGPGGSNPSPPGAAPKRASRNRP